FLLCLVLNLAACAFSYTKKTAVAGIVVLVLVAICTGMALHRGAGEAAVYAVVVCAACLGLFFLTRTRVGAALALPLGVLIIAGEMLFQYGSHPALLCLFLLSSGCLAFSRIYRGNMLRAATRRAAVSAHALLSISACVLALGLAAAVYFAVVKPLSPPSYEITLKTELKRLPLLEKLGVATVISLPDPDKRTDNIFESDLLADLSGEDRESPPPSEQPTEEGQPEDNSALPPSPTPADAIRYNTGSRPWLYAAAAVVLAVLAAVLGRLVLRRRKLLRIQKLPPGDQVTELYSRVLRVLELCGLPPMRADSPMEYCAAFGTRIQRILGEQADFKELTGVFERAFYGGLTPSDGECAAFIALCRRLPSLCRKSIGPLRYSVTFFKV
ncbi:MAG: DUF4129 domain-containing protein, partial [Clostridia bacterium]|nr:DUF4129 domain-containing protein [Clostridia bacterium]